MSKNKASGIPVYCDHSALVDVTDLKPNPRNPNTHSDKQIALLAKNIASMGWRHALVVSKRSGLIVSGHGRLQAAQLLKVEKVPVDYQDFGSEAEEFAVLISDNRLSELSEPDPKFLKNLLSELDGEMGLKDIELTGYTQAEWEMLMTSGNLPPPISSDEEGSSEKEKSVTCPDCGKIFKA